MRKTRVNKAFKRSKLNQDREFLRYFFKLTLKKTHYDSARHLIFISRRIESNQTNRIAWPKATLVDIRLISID